ncbi:MAG: hypothetical protein HOK61_12580 [Alphaproteobacteria bacterium]|nr:hypothetical protein [Alphaproteobacteria bacterium]
MKTVFRLWRGELALADAFWNWAAVGGLAVNLVSSAAFLFLIMAEQPVVAALAGYVFSVPYNIVVVVGVWRSAARYDGEQKWADLARIVTAAGMILLSVT